MRTTIVLEDIPRECEDCRALFIWTAGEQRFYQAHDLRPPRRCVHCRRARALEREQHATRRAAR